LHWPKGAAAGHLCAAALHMTNLFPAQDFDSAMVAVRTLIADDSISLIQPNSFVVLIPKVSFLKREKRRFAMSAIIDDFEYFA
jgi:hypothetical protein